MRIGRDGAEFVNKQRLRAIARWRCSMKPPGEIYFIWKNTEIYISFETKFQCLWRCSLAGLQEKLKKTKSVLFRSWVLLKVEQIEVVKLRAALRAAAGPQWAQYKEEPLAASLKQPFQWNTEPLILLCGHQQRLNCHHRSNLCTAPRLLPRLKNWTRTSTARKLHHNYTTTKTEPGFEVLRHWSQRINSRCWLSVCPHLRQLIDSSWGQGHRWKHYS